VIKVGSCVKSHRILHVLAPKIFRGGSPKFLDLHYKIDVNTNHAAKFRGDRLRELGDPIAN